MQEKFTTLRAATARVQELMNDDDRVIESVYIIEDCREGAFYVEDNCPLIRNFERLHW